MKIPKALSLERKRQAWELHLQFYKHHEIAEKLNMKVSAVSRMLGRLNKQFKDKLQQDIEDVKYEQIARLEHIAREAFFAWERSKEDYEILRKSTGLMNGEPVGIGTAGKEIRDQYGDPRYLKEAREAMNEIRKIMGADAPLKIQHSGDKEADAIKLDYTTTLAGFLEELASLTKQGKTETIPE
jgi:gas vesicle protein